jgi:hypothetical protein
VKGVTYGTFAPDEDGNQFPSRERVTADFRLMKMHGFNSVRVYTVPPRFTARLLDVARDAALRRRLGDAWRDRVLSHHTWQRNAERVIERLTSGGATAATLTGATTA